MKKSFVTLLFISILVMICLYLCFIGREKTASVPSRGPSQQCRIKPESVAEALKQTRGPDYQEKGLNAGTVKSSEDMQKVNAPPTIVSQAEGERIIDEVVKDIASQYPPTRKVDLVEFMIWKTPLGEYALLKNVDLFLTADHGGPAVVELFEKSLVAGKHFAGEKTDAFSSLANFPAHPKYRHKIVELTHSANPAVRVAATLTLGRMPNVSLIPVLTQLLKDPNPDVRIAAVLALGPDEWNLITTFIWESDENLQLTKRAVAMNQNIEILHPYIGSDEVYFALVDYMASGIRPKDMPGILKTMLNLKEKRVLAKYVQVHHQNPQYEGYLQQYYRKLEALPD
jgi:hypothetical protein